MNKGTPLAAANQQAAEIESKIRALLAPPPAKEEKG